MDKDKPVRRYVGWTTDEFVADHLGQPMLDQQDRRFLHLCVQAANRAVALWRPDLTPPEIVVTDGPFSADFNYEFAGGADVVQPADPMIVLGTTMLAARWFTRRSGFDVAAFAEMGAGPLPVLDADLSAILRVGRAHLPVVG